MASGMIVDFNIDPDLVGIAIGKKGARIKQVEKDSGVSSVNVDGKSGASI
jgi:transcription antitermination factor NusA-like protein